MQLIRQLSSDVHGGLVHLSREFLQRVICREHCGQRKKAAKEPTDYRWPSDFAGRVPLDGAATDTRELLLLQALACFLGTVCATCLDHTVDWNPLYSAMVRHICLRHM